jgi:hypothetical protein
MQQATSLTSYVPLQDGKITLQNSAMSLMTAVTRCSSTPHTRNANILPVGLSSSCINQSKRFCSKQRKPIPAMLGVIHYPKHYLK